MKIKTIARNFDWLEEFDQEVNKALDEGWHLMKREVLPGVAGVSSSRRLLYAELVQMEPVDPDELDEVAFCDPFDALRAVQDLCRSVDKCGTCPLYDWCCQLRKGGDPDDWKIPGKEGEQ